MAFTILPRTRDSGESQKQPGRDEYLKNNSMSSEAERDCAQTREYTKYSSSLGEVVKIVNGVWLLASFD